MITVKAERQWQHVLRDANGRWIDTPGAGNDASPEERVWNGKERPEESQLSWIEQGSLGEQLAINVLSDLHGTPFKSVNVGINNAPLDVVGGNWAVEVKSGMGTNGKSAQHWRITLGQPGEEEKAAMDLMDRKEKLEHNTWKRDQALKRKNTLVRSMGQKVGEEMKGMTVGVILDGQGTRGDVYLVPGFHKYMSWKKFATDEYYVGTYDIEDTVKSYWGFRWV